MVLRLLDNCSQQEIEEYEKPHTSSAVKGNEKKINRIQNVRHNGKEQWANQTKQIERTKRKEKSYSNNKF